MINVTNFFDITNLICVDKKDFLTYPKVSSQDSDYGFRKVLKETIKTVDNKDTSRKDASKNNHLTKIDKKDTSADKHLTKVDKQESTSEIDNEKPIQDEKSISSEDKSVKDPKADSKDELNQEGKQKLEELAKELGVDEQTLTSLLQALNIDLNNISKIQNLGQFKKDIKQVLETVIQKLQMPDDLNKLIEDIPISDKVKMVIEKLDSRKTSDSDFVEELIQKLSEKIEANSIKSPNKEETSKDVLQSDVNNSQNSNKEEVLKNVLQIEVKNPQNSGKEEVSKDALQIETNNISQVEDVGRVKAKANETNKGLNTSNIQTVPQDEELATNSNSSKNSDGNQEKGFKNPLFENLKVINLQTVKGSVNFSADMTIPADIMQNGVISNKLEALQNTLQIANSQRSEIFNQIVEQAKLVLKDSQTEMEMTLKPENLGKLAIKVVTENGLVVARIITQNEQVKQMIESNLAQFQEDLKQQGLSIQEFSVTVGQDKRQEFLQQQAANQKQNRLSSISINNAGASQNYIQNQGVKNPYLVSESRIDFTA